MARTYSIDYNSYSEADTDIMLRDLEKLIKKSKSVNQSRRLTENEIIYSYSIKTKTFSDETLDFNMLVNRQDSLNKAKFDSLYFKTKARLKSIKLFKTRVAACAIAVGTFVSAYNLPGMIEDISSSIKQFNETNRKADGIYTKDEWDKERMQMDPYYNPNIPTEEEKEQANKEYYTNDELGQLEKMMEDLNQESKGKGR